MLSIFTRTFISGEGMTVAMEWTLNRRSENPESPKTVSEKNEIKLQKSECLEFLNVLQSKNGSKVRIHQLMPKFLKITSPGKANPVSQLMHLIDDDNNDNSKKDISPYVNITFQLEKAENSAGVWWNAVEENPSSNFTFLQSIDNVTRNNSETKSLIIYTFNDKMFPPGLLSIISGKG